MLDSLSAHVCAVAACTIFRVPEVQGQSRLTELLAGKAQAKKSPGRERTVAISLQVSDHDSAEVLLHGKTFDLST